MSIMMYMLRHVIRQSRYAPKPWAEIVLRSSSSNDKKLSPRMQEFKKKLQKTPINQLEDQARHHYVEQEPLESFPNSTNPRTGEVGGPKGPEPTRYGDWERKGRVSDF